MFEKYMIVEDDIHPTIENDAVTSFSFGARLPYYRGLGISMLEDIVVTVDDLLIPKEKLKLTIHGNTYTSAQMEIEPDDRWEMGEIAHITVPLEKSISKGTHRLSLFLNLRIAYLPFPAIRQSEKIVTI